MNFDIVTLYSFIFWRIYSGCKGTEEEEEEK